MDEVGYTYAVNQHWGRNDLGQAILNALSAQGKDLDALTIDDLAPMDQFHRGGKDTTMLLARLAGATPGLHVLDAGGGLGGPARTLAVEFGCRVTAIDLTESYVRAAEQLTARLGLDNRVTHQFGNALDLNFDDGAFDVVWTQNSGMNIADKARLYREFHRVLRPRGVLALQEPLAGPVQPPIFPLMWADDASNSFLLAADKMRGVIEDAGFGTKSWEVIKADQPSPPPNAASIQYLVKGDALAAISAAGERNRVEQRLLTGQGVFERL